MELYSEGKNFKLYNGNMLDVLEELPENSIDAIVTDPPYEINFMGKNWDNAGVALQKSTWEKCLRVLKPGGHMLVFGFPRMYHRVTCSIEDAGFEIRDTIMWLYGSGFPKSMSLGKVIEGKQVLGSANVRDIKKLNGKKEIVGGGWNSNEVEQGKRKREYEQVRTDVEYTTELGKQWQGWGTALKPSFEPIIVARKPFKGSLVDNVIENGVGGINIDECRVPLEKNYKYKETTRNKRSDGTVFDNKHTGFRSENNNTASASPKGRFPSNTILTYDETDYDEVCGGFPDSAGCKPHNIYSNMESYEGWGTITQKNGELVGYDDCGGSAARYFYCAKASKRDRDEGLDSFSETPMYVANNEHGNLGAMYVKKAGGEIGDSHVRKNNHPTVKPTSLMQYLVRLITPKGGTVLDPFTGSGSTGKATMYENVDRNANYKFIGVELDSHYCDIATARIRFAEGSPIMLEKETKEMNIEKPISKPVTQKKKLF